MYQDLRTTSVNQKEKEKKKKKTSALLKLMFQLMEIGGIQVSPKE